MEKQQNQFFEWMLERVIPGKEQELTALLQENFQKQQAGSFGGLDLAISGKKILALIKPEHVEEFKQAMAHFSKGLK